MGNRSRPPLRARRWVARVPGEPCAPGAARAPSAERARRTPHTGRPSLATLAALVTALVAVVATAPMIVTAQTGEEPSNVVLVFDVSNSILLATDGTNVEFAAALEGIADRVDVVADDLAAGNAQISFVVFARTAVVYPKGCEQLDLHGDRAAITTFESCLRSIAKEYRDGAKAPVRQRVNTNDTDHVAALDEAAALLPDKATRSAVIFFTDGQHDPPGTSRDNENVVARVTPAYAGHSPLAILPVGLGARAGGFETELTAIYQAFFRDMQPCAGRASFSWPQVIFPSADAAGSAVALALQEVTCSFTVAPTPTPIPTPSPTPAILAAPTGVRVLAGNRTLTVQWLPASADSPPLTSYLVRCRPASGGNPVEITQPAASTPEAVLDGLNPGDSYACEVAATDGVSTSDYAAAGAPVVVLGIPNAPGQPRAEPLDNAARLSVDRIAAGAPVEQYVYECTGPNGATARGSGSDPSVVVTGLPNGVEFQCVAYAENRIGRSAASPASARFAACGGLLDCNPWLKIVLPVVVLATVLAVAFVAWRRYQMRNRVWIMAQVDGGENTSLGWGPELGISLDRDDNGWVANPRALEAAPIRVRYMGKHIYLVGSGPGMREVRSGDPTPIRDASGNLHRLILRQLRGKPRTRGSTAPTPVAAQPSDPASAAVGTRLNGREQEPPPDSPMVG